LGFWGERNIFPIKRLYGWQLSTVVLSAALLAPIIMVFIVASGDTGGLWGHLFDSVVPRYLTNTLSLMFGVAIVSLVFGVSTAWLVVRYDFRMRRFFEWLLLLPAAMPAYLIAYTYGDFLEYSGPVQRIIRDLGGWESSSDYWFPQIRSLEGACLLMGSVLYPYVYVMARVGFLLIPSTFFDVSNLVSRNGFWSVGIPLARPAIMAGTALVLMETISEFGVVEYFSIQTFTLGIFNVWLGMNNITAAAQIACLCFIFIVILISIEVISRSRQRFTDTTKKSQSLSPIKKRGLGEIICWLLCVLPIGIGFLIPMGVLLGFVFEGYSVGFNSDIADAAINSLIIGVSVAAIIISVSSFMLFTSKYRGPHLLKNLSQLSSLGYAFPGAILAIGVVSITGYLDRAIADVSNDLFNAEYQGFFGGSIGLIIFACVIRFQAIGYGAVSKGIERVPNNLVEASQVLGSNFMDQSTKIIIPMIRLSILAGALLVFVDVMKELPMALILRPFNFETLATYIYQFAKDELLEEAALPAVMIVATGIIPVLFLNFTINKLTRI
tara:strand:- start:3554 stop:5209 length:1656 start_codon:yes stop_codon:yes gene_type:complete